MLKIYLVSVLPVQPLPFSFSLFFCLFQRFFSFPSASLLLFFFFSLLVQPPFLLSLFWFNALFFFFTASFFSSFCSCVALFSAQKHFSAQNISLFNPKPFLVQPKTFFFQPKTFLFCCFTSLYLSKSSFSSNLK